MSFTKGKIPLSKALNIARRFLTLIDPFCIKAEISGSIRRQCKEVSEIVVVCVEDRDNPLSELFRDNYPGMVTNGKRFKKFQYPKDNIQVELYVVPAYDYGRMLAIRTGSSAFTHIKLSITWNRKGWCTTDKGLRRKKECEKKGSKWVLKEEYLRNPTLPPIFKTEYDFFDFLGIEYILPQYRNWVSKHGALNY